MSISTYSLFYYGHTVDDTNNSIDLDEGGSELQATLTAGEYTLTQYLAEWKRALDAVGAQAYTVTVDRSTRLVTIFAAGHFKLRVASGSRLGTTAYAMVGFTGADRTGASTYTGNVATGSQYAPQYPLQDYVSPLDESEAVDVKVNESASGQIEVVKFGDRSFMECNICWATDKNPTGADSIHVQASGLTNLRAFMRYITTKAPIEFMENVAAPDVFYPVLLESTKTDKAGTGFRLKERIQQQAPGYFDTDVLIFRVVT